MLLIKTGTLIGAPILCGVLFFLARAPGGPGVYVETSSGIYAVSGYQTQSVSSLSDVPAKLAAIPEGDVRSFFIVAARGAASAESAGAVKLYLFRTDASGVRFGSQFISVPVTVRTVNGRAYHITPDRSGWAVTRLPESLGNLIAGLVIQDSAGSLQLYPVRLGPSISSAQSNPGEKLR